MNIPARADVVIIGGGIIGCSIAYHLTKLGITVCPELTLDEKGEYSNVGCFVEDGGGPPGAGVQAQASNRHELLGR